MIKLTCLRCGHTWIPRQEVVNMCPKCKSRNWNIPKSKNVLVYNGKYGKLIINLDTTKIDDQLDREKIWVDAHESYSEQQIIYSQILDDMNIVNYAHPAKSNQFWNGVETDFGFKAILDNGTELIIDSEGTFLRT